MNERDHIPEYVLDALEEVRASGATNMLARVRVMEELDEMYAVAAHLWLRRNPQRYMEAITEMGERRRHANETGGPADRA